MSGAEPDAGAQPSKERTTRSGNTVPEPRVTTMFDSIAPVYDRMNTIMTAGLDGRWRRAAASLRAQRP